MFGEPPLFEPEAILHFHKPIRQIAYTADGRLGVLDKDGNFRILDLNTSQAPEALESTPPLRSCVAAFSFYLRGKPIVALRCWGEETAILLDYEDNKQLKQIALPLNTATEPTGTTNASDLPRWPDRSLNEDQIPLRLPDTATAAACAPDGHWLASLERDNRIYRIRRRDVATGELRDRAEASGDPIALAVNDDGHVFAFTKESERSGAMGCLQRRDGPSLARPERSHPES
jgi:hypothetical protein